MGNIYSYVLSYDAGSAPNPFGGLCSLTICTPNIKKRAQVGDWIIGLGSKKQKAMIEKVMIFQEELFML